MKFTGKNLLLVREAIRLAIDEVHNMIATCPDVIDFADDIEEYEITKAQLEKLAARIDAVHLER